MSIFKLPDLGEGLTEAEIHEWHVKEGDTVKVDQPLVSMETAKAVVEVPSPVNGKITKLFGKVGDIIDTDGPLVEFELSEKETSSTKSVTHDQGSVVGQMHGQVQILAENNSKSSTSSSTANNTIRALPAARALAQQKNIDLTQLQGTGPNGLITVKDVENAKNTTSAAALFTDGEPLRGVRRHMVSSMKKSHDHVVDVTVVDDAYLTQWAGQNDITLRVLRALIAGCQTETSLNAWFDGENLQRKLHKAIHIGLAMDSDDGLFVPVLKNAEQQSPQQLRETIQRFKIQVKDRTIPQDDLQGSTIMLSNFGMFAGRYANPIIVPPNVAILGVGRLRTAPVVSNDQVTIARVLPLSLTIDHRAVTGGEATRFLAAVIKDLEKSE